MIRALLARWCEALAAVCLVAIGIGNVVAAQVLPVHEEPRHRVVFEHEGLRVLDINIEAGDTTLDHTHSNDVVTVCISGSEIRTRVVGAAWSDVRHPRPGEPNVTEYTGQAGTHRAQNLGPNLFRLIAVENLRQSGWLQGKPAAGTATTLVRETRAFRIYDVHLAAGSLETTHIHMVPAVAILITGGLVARGERAQPPSVLNHPGSRVFVPAGESHTLASTGGGEAHIVEIEVR